ncbi:uncharacterized protein [Temnothorax longispinosus]|uniref:uncharacterized protein n=1 Tax=Temnothorax longispinosus TaxID=300112 RepID=UPI003A9A1DE3
MAFSKFLDYLRLQKSNIILVAHNGFRFDAPIIIRHMKKFGLFKEFQEIVKGFADTLEIFRENLSTRKKKNLIKNHLLMIYLVLIQLMKSMRRVLLTYCEYKCKQSKLPINKASLESLNEISSSMKMKIAKNAINLKILKEAYMQSGDERVRLLLGEDVRGKPRVTKNIKILKSITHQLAM